MTRPPIHPLVTQTLSEIAKRTGGAVLDVADIVWIHRLCERVINPVEGERADLCGWPVRVGVSDVWFWPLSVGASIWWRDKACPWFDGEPHYQYLALCFALANGRDKAAIRAVSESRKTALAQILKWTEGLVCTQDEMTATLDLLLPDKRQEEKQEDLLAAPARADYDRIIGEIEALTGIPAEHWMWDVSRDYALRAFARSRAVAAAMSGCSVGALPSAVDQALLDLGAAKAEIIAKYRETGADKA